jgi:hypothetical protein
MRALLLAKAFPSRSAMKNLEFRLGADCSIMVCYEIDITITNATPILGAIEGIDKTILKGDP